MNDELSISYNVVFKCYAINDINQLLDIEFIKNSEIEEIILNLDKISASNFLYRFANNVFIVNNKYKIYLRYNADHTFSGIFIKDITIDSNNLFVVTNFLEVLQAINEGYIRIRTLEKVESLLRYDFESSYNESNEGIVDEFDIDSKDNN